MSQRKKVKKQITSGRTFTVYFLTDEEAGGFTAHIPALGIVTEGESLTEAREMARDAIEGRLAVLEELGLDIPDDIVPERVKV
jgi:predicted RNase H-like HicB family nuclease